MSFPMKFFDEMAADEDDLVTQSLYRYYWILPQVSMLFPSWKRSAIPMSIGLLLFHGTVFITNFSLLAYSIVLLLYERNWELFSLLIHYGVIMIVSMCVATVYNNLRQNTAQQQRLLATDVGIYTGERIYSEEWCVDLHKRLRIQKFYFLSLPILIGFNGAVIIAVPYITKLASGVEHPYTTTGINMNLPIAGWYPFPTHEGILHLVAASGQGVCVASHSIIIFCSMFIAIDVTQRLRYEFRIIGYSLDTIFTRSLKLYHLKYPEKKSIEPDVMDYDFQRVIEIYLRETLIHHQRLSEMIEITKVQYNMPAAFTYIAGTIVIGISLYSILVALNTQNYGSIVTFVLLIIAEILTIFQVSLLGALLTYESEDLRNDVYFMKWYDMDLRNRRTVLNFQTAITKPITLKAVGIIELNMRTFSSAMNSAYSFFNIMNAK